MAAAATAKSAEGEKEKLLDHGHGTPARKGPSRPSVKLAASAELPDMMAPPSAGARRDAFVKLKAWLEPARAEGEAVVAASMPRPLDLFQTRPREMRLEGERGSAGAYRPREEPIARANIAPPPWGGSVLFTELLVQ